MTIKLIVGLGNIGSKYVNTRHNFGAAYVMLLAKKYRILLCKNKKLCGYIGKLKLRNNTIRLLIPNFYMNENGISVSICANIYQLLPEEILIAHDDLDLLPGKIRIKLGKKFKNSHNGVQSVVIKLKNKFNFYRLRIGIGRPINNNEIIDFVLSQSSICEANIINDVLNEVIRNTEDIVYKNFSQVMNRLHLYCSNFVNDK